MTSKELQRTIGRTGTLTVAGHAGTLQVAVKVVDAKNAWGNTRYEVVPIKGTGRAWVASERVQLDPVDETVRQTSCAHCGLDIEGIAPFRPGTWRDRGNNATTCNDSPRKHAPIKE